MLGFMRRVFAIGLVSVAVALVGCGDTATRTVKPRVFASGFNGPTQIVDGPDGTLLVAQLAGEENAAAGEVIVFDPATNKRRVLLSGLMKPTGVLWRSGEVWVMVQRGLGRAAWPGGSANAGPVETLLSDLPFNGRSEGTLTSLPDGRILYETSGNLIAGAIEPGSGTLWAFDPATRTSAPVAINVKNAYAHALLPDGRIVVSDIGDNIANPPVDEVNIVNLDAPGPPSATPADLGWPRCPGDTSCEGVVPPLATFPIAATPTGVAVIGTTTYVALFVRGEIARIPPTPTGEPTVVVTGLKGPHTLLARPDGTLLVTEHITGRILSVRP
jgi:glucose/arabinose dehydrogenase